MIKIEQTIEIEELREAGEDGGDLMGYYCRGHVERYLFAEAANNRSGAAPYYDRRHVDPKQCRHVWYRTAQMEGEPRGTMEFRATTPGERGAWAATVWDGILGDERARMRRILKDHQGGRCNGIAEGVNWCLRWLEPRDQELYDQMWKAFREQRDKIESAA